MKSVNVLILDDEENILTYLKRLLVDEQYEVLFTQDPQEALNVLQQEKVKVVLSDQSMPSTSGIEFIKKVQEISAHTVCLLFTADIDDPKVQDALAKGEIYRSLSKPCKETELKSSIKQAIEKFDLEEENRRLAQKGGVESDQSAELKQKTVLIIDDEVNISNLIGYHLKEKGYAYVTAEDGVQGLEKLKVVTPDLIILDVNMPNMSGIQFLTEILTAHGKPKYPVLMLTTRANLEPTFKDIDVSGFVAKPFDINNLIAEAERIIQGRVTPLVYLLDFGRSFHSQQIAATLAREKYEVINLADLNQLLDRSKTHKPNFIFIEYESQESAAENAIKRIKNDSFFNDVPILVFSYSGEEKYEKSALSSGALKYLNSPNDYEAFITAIREMEMNQNTNY